jgi:hypothetical protein
MTKRKQLTTATFFTLAINAALFASIDSVTACRLGR